MNPGAQGKTRRPAIRDLGKSLQIFEPSLSRHYSRARRWDSCCSTHLCWRAPAQTNLWHSASGCCKSCKLTWRGGLRIQHWRCRYPAESTLLGKLLADAMAKRNALAKPAPSCKVLIAVEELYLFPCLCEGSCTTRDCLARPAWSSVPRPFSMHCLEF